MRTAASANSPYRAPNISDDADLYEDFLRSLQTRFYHVTNGYKDSQLFVTKTSSLFELFLAGMPLDRRQHYTCHSCRHFLERFGGLVVIDENGNTKSVLWDPQTAPPFFDPSVRLMKSHVESQPVAKPFYTDLKVWGEPVTGTWHHMAVRPPRDFLRKPTPLQNLDQLAAEKIQEFDMLNRGLKDFNIETVRQAETLLKTDALYRSEKCLGVATWLLELHTKLDNVHPQFRRDNIIWKAVYAAPPGFCHVRSTMIGTLLEDIASGMKFDLVSRRFAEKMHPLQYQRPTAAPSEGQIDAAEKVISTLRSAGALERRFAYLEDLELLWEPKKVAPKPRGKKGVFDHLRAEIKDVPTSLHVPVRTMTWSKFVAEVLPIAEKIEYYVTNERQDFTAYVTAARGSAPPILQWDSEDRRNPVSWYLYHGGSSPSNWRITPNQWTEVTGISLRPFMWYGETKFTNQHKGALIVLKGCKDTGYRTAGGGLFPELLKNEYHAIRHVIEAHSRQMEIKGYMESTACGVTVAPNQARSHKFRVLANGVVMTYTVDRWD